MIKTLLLAALLMGTAVTVSAQRYYREGEHGRDRDPRPEQEETFGDGFKKEHIFIGGNVGLGFDSYTFNAGLSPEIGYSVASWLDAGMLFNFNYTSIRADEYYNGNTRQRSFNYGTGAFIRAYPLPFLFFQVSPEYNWVHYTQTYFDASPRYSSSFNTNAASLLLGIGYGQRIVGRNNMHLALLVDVLDNPQSPYRDYNNRIMPVIKAGFDFYLKPRKH